MLPGKTNVSVGEEMLRNNRDGAYEKNHFYFINDSVERFSGERGEVRPGSTEERIRKEEGCGKYKFEKDPPQVHQD